MGVFGLRGPDESASLIEGRTTLAETLGKKIVISLGVIDYTKKGIAGDAPKLQ